MEFHEGLGRKRGHLLYGPLQTAAASNANGGSSERHDGHGDNTEDSSDQNHGGDGLPA